jgi:hypothetical protein
MTPPCRPATIGTVHTGQLLEGNTMRSPLGRLALWTAEALDRILLTVPDLDLDESYSPSRSARTAVTDGAA